MRKIVSICLTVVMVVSLVACGTQNESAGKYTTTPREYVFGGSTSTGSFFVQSAAVANIWENSEYVSNISIEATTGSFENLLLVSGGEADFGLASSLAVSCANLGREPYGEIQDNLSSICYGAPSTFHFVVRADSDIKCIDDIRGHAVSTGTVGSGAEQEIREALAVLDITYDDFTRVDYIGVGDGLSALKDGKVDVAFCDVGFPNSSVLEACTGDDLRILEFSDEEINKILQECDWIGPAVIPGGIYKGIDLDVNTICTYTIFLANKNIPDEIIYEMAKELYTGYDNLCKSNTIFDSWSFTKEMGSLIEVHPGALKYYEEVGVD